MATGTAMSIPKAKQLGLERFKTECRIKSISSNPFA
tara:strand:+ start:462 stop:569 length:108 start_codon:yes stop_codon:yes gene_type:complete